MNGSSAAVMVRHRGQIYRSNRRQVIPCLAMTVAK